MSIAFQDATVPEKPKAPNEFLDAVARLKPNDPTSALKFTVPGDVKDTSVNSKINKAAEAHNVTVRRSIGKPDKSGARVFTIWAVDRIVRKTVDTDTDATDE